MKKILFLLIIFSLPLTLMAQKPSIGVGAFFGYDYPVLQDDQTKGTVFGFKADWNVVPILTVEPYISFTKFGDPESTDFPGLFDGMEGSKVTSFGVNALLGGSRGGLGAFPYFFAGIGTYSTKRDLTDQDYSKMGIGGGAGVEVGVSNGIAFDLRGKINISGTEGDASKKSAAVTIGVNYYFNK